MKDVQPVRKGEFNQRIISSMNKEQQRTKIETNEYNPRSIMRHRMMRKILLKSLDDATNNNSTMDHNNMKNDSVFNDPMLRSLMEESKDDVTKFKKTKRQRKESENDNETNTRKFHFLSLQIQRSSFRLKIGYDEMTVGDALRQIIPPLPTSSINSNVVGVEPGGNNHTIEECDTNDDDDDNDNDNDGNQNDNNAIIPSSFEAVGGVARLSLPSSSSSSISSSSTFPYHAYKYLIGRVLLDKNKGLNIVVNKMGNICNKFRTYPMEILADDRTANLSNRKSNKRRRHDDDECNDDTNTKHDIAIDTTVKNDNIITTIGTICNKLEVEVREEGCKFRLDFANVYWNSRLQHEHRTMVHLIIEEVIGGHDIKNDGGFFNNNFIDRKHQQRKLSSLVSNRQLEKNNKSHNGSSKQVDKSGDNDSNNINTNRKKRKVIIADACAGVGPFAIPLALAGTPTISKKGGSNNPKNILVDSNNNEIMFEVHANDLNPSSYHYLNMNKKINNCSDVSLLTYNEDARLFLRRLEGEDQDGSSNNNKEFGGGVLIDHVIMNLPAIAPELLNVFRGWKGGGGGVREECISSNSNSTATTTAATSNPTSSSTATTLSSSSSSSPCLLPTVHVHCFGGKGESAFDEAIERCERALGCSLRRKKLLAVVNGSDNGGSVDSNNSNIENHNSNRISDNDDIGSNKYENVVVRIIRDVSPKKNMLCVSFRLPPEVKDLDRIEKFDEIV